MDMVQLFYICGLVWAPPTELQRICDFASLFCAVMGLAGVPAGFWPLLLFSGVPALDLPEQRQL